MHWRLKDSPRAFGRLRTANPNSSTGIAICHRTSEGSFEHTPQYLILPGTGVMLGLGGGPHAAGLINASPSAARRACSPLDLPERLPRLCPTCMYSSRPRRSWQLAGPQAECAAPNVQMGNPGRSGNPANRPETPRCTNPVAVGCCCGLAWPWVGLRQGGQPNLLVYTIVLDYNNSYNLRTCYDHQNFDDHVL